MKRAHSMLKIGQLTLNGTPRVAVGFSDSNLPHSITEAQRAGVDIAEIRIDQFSSYDQNYVKGKLALFSEMPSIATIRVEEEGGKWNDSEERRQNLYESIVPYVDAVDIELNSSETLDNIRPIVKKNEKLLIVSFHNYQTTPDRATLDAIIAKADAKQADIIKIATNVSEPVHIPLLASLLIDNPTKKLIIIGMGGKGLPTRLLFPALGSVITFAYWHTEPRTAPGQLPYGQMFDLLRLFFPTYNEQKISDLKLLECV